MCHLSSREPGQSWKPALTGSSFQLIWPCNLNFLDLHLEPSSSVMIPIRLPFAWISGCSQSNNKQCGHIHTPLQQCHFCRQCLLHDNRHQGFLPQQHTPTQRMCQNSNGNHPSHHHPVVRFGVCNPHHSSDVFSVVNARDKNFVRCSTRCIKP